MVYRSLLTFCALVAAPVAQAGSIAMPADAAQPVYTAPEPIAAGGPEVVLTLGAGLAVKPEYFGSSDYGAGPSFGVRLNYLNVGPLNFGSLNGDPASGIGLRGSFRYVGERVAGDYPELDGLDDVDATVELGLGLGYRSRNFDAFADVRYGIGGHESLVGELGADYKIQPADRLTVSLGPRVLLGSDDYTSTYFGISAAEAAASDYTAYAADGGVVSAGVELGARYEINDVWGVQGAVTYDRFMGDAADSPIVEQGERDQYGLRIGLTRQITLDF